MPMVLSLSRKLFPIFLISKAQERALLACSAKMPSVCCCVIRTPLYLNPTCLSWLCAVLDRLKRSRSDLKHLLWNGMHLAVQMSSYSILTHIPVVCLIPYKKLLLLCLSSGQILFVVGGRVV